jgi:hypothetical protein
MVRRTRRLRTAETRGRTVPGLPFLKRTERAGQSVLALEGQNFSRHGGYPHHILADFHDFREKGHSNGCILVDHHFVLPRDAQPGAPRTAESGSDFSFRVGSPRGRLH